ncbi:MAG: NDP-sugar synthase [Acidobacteria bacterium]|nr:NDP-sugar synthase [Acidobacteriota bacterium]
MQALILAGGKGIRLRPLTIHTPKPIVPVANRPFLHYQIELLKRAGITDITLSLSYQPNKIEEVFGDGSEHGVRIRYTVESDPLGTAGAFKHAHTGSKSATVVLNGDILTNVNLAELVAYHHRKEALATIVTVPVENPSLYGMIEADETGRVLRYVEKPKAEEAVCKTINAGIYVLEPRVLELIPDEENYSFELGLFPKLVAAGAAFYAYGWYDYWLDIGAPQRYLQAHDDLLNGRIKTFQLTRPPRDAAQVEGETAKIDKLSIVHPTCILKPGAEIINSVLGANCVIEERARIENSVLWSSTRVGQSAVVRRSFIGKGGIIGRNTTIEGAILGDKSSLTDYTII